MGKGLKYKGEKSPFTNQFSQEQIKFNIVMFKLQDLTQEQVYEQYNRSTDNTQRGNK